MLQSAAESPTEQHWSDRQNLPSLPTFARAWHAWYTWPPPNPTPLALHTSRIMLLIPLLTGALTTQHSFFIQLKKLRTLGLKNVHTYIHTHQYGKPCINHETDQVVFSRFTSYTVQYRMDARVRKTKCNHLPNPLENHSCSRSTSQPWMTTG